MPSLFTTRSGTGTLSPASRPVDTRRVWGMAEDQ